MGGSGRLGGRGVALRTIFQASGEASKQQARAVSPQGRGWSGGVPALHREGFLVTELTGRLLQPRSAQDRHSASAPRDR